MDAYRCTYQKLLIFYFIGMGKCKFLTEGDFWAKERPEILSRGAVWEIKVPVGMRKMRLRDQLSERLDETYS